MAGRKSRQQPDFDSIKAAGWCLSDKKTIPNKQATCFAPCKETSSKEDDPVLEKQRLTGKRRPRREKVGRSKVGGGKVTRERERDGMERIYIFDGVRVAADKFRGSIALKRCFP